MSPRPLVRRRPDGSRYVAPGELPTARPRYSTGLPPQPGSSSVSGPEPTPTTEPRSARVRVSDETVREVRAEHAKGKWSMTELAYIFGLTYHVTRGIALGQTYTDVRPEPTEP